MESNGFLHCPLCGMEFERIDTVCVHGCPLGASCNLVRCPTCSYEFPRTPRAPSWLRRLFGRATSAAQPRCGTTLGLDGLSAGERARVTRLTCRGSDRRNTLTVFGLVPGADITLLQRRPSFVVRVGQTELALDTEVARQILVQRL